MKGATVSEYKELTLAYGIITILLVKQHFEEIEEYIECHKIVQALELMDQEYGTNTDKTLTDLSYFVAQNFYNRKGLDPSIDELKRKFKYYSNIVLKIVTA